MVRTETGPCTKGAVAGPDGAIDRSLASSQPANPLNLTKSCATAHCPTQKPELGFHLDHNLEPLKLVFESFFKNFSRYEGGPLSSVQGSSLARISLTWHTPCRFLAILLRIGVFCIPQRHNTVGQLISCVWVDMPPTFCRRHTHTVLVCDTCLSVELVLLALGARDQTAPPLFQTVIRMVLHCMVLAASVRVVSP
jgi:hypothetical protein